MTTGRSTLAWAFGAGAAVGILGGLIGLGGAEFRLPLLISAFGFVALQAVILNKAMSLAVVVTALPARLSTVPLAALAPHWPLAVNLLAGSLVGAWVGASWATRTRTTTLHRVLAVLLLLMAAVLLVTHEAGTATPSGVPDAVRVATGLAAGFGIGVVAAVMGVAGGELLIPTITLLGAVDVRTAGSLSLVVSLPTMLVALARYSRDQAFGVLRAHAAFALAMTVGSVAGAIGGGQLLGVVPTAALVPVLAVILVLSAVRLWRHR